MQTEQTPDNRRRFYLIALVVFIVLPLALFFGLAYLAFRPTILAEPTICVTEVSESRQIRLTVEPLEVSQIYNERYHFEITQDGGATWQTVTDTTVPFAERPVSCETNIRIISDSYIILWHSEAIFITQDGGATWNTWESCDEPRPSFGCVNAEYIESITLLDSTDVQADVFAPEGPYTILTTDAGQTWQLLGEADAG